MPPQKDKDQIVSGVSTHDDEQVKPTSEQSARDMKDSLAHAPDRELHPAGMPKDPAAKTSYPVPSETGVEDPPIRTTRHDVPILRSLATGAGAHVPPDPDKYHADGRPRD